MAPLTRGRCDPYKRLPNEILKTYYEQRASAGLIITEASGVSDQGHGWYGAPALYTEEQAEGWKKAVSAVHAKGGKIFFQMWHMGRQGHSSYHQNKDLVAPSAIGVGSGQTTSQEGEQVDYEVPRALETIEVEKIPQDYKNSAQLAKKAGFDGIEIHSANGYLLDQFLQSCSNQRTDKYGGSFENRLRLLKEVFEAVKQIFPASKIGIRFTPNGQFGGMGSKDNFEMFSYVFQQVNSWGLAYIHIIDGVTMGTHDKCKLFTLADVRQLYKGTIVGNGGYTKESAQKMIQSGDGDCIAFGKPYISNPDLVERFKNNWPIAEQAPFPHFWTQSLGAEGYTSYPNYQK